MTQSNFKYSSGQAGSTLFAPQKEAKPYDPFDKQAASQPILDALRRNKEIEVENIGRTGDYGLESMRIEHANAEGVARHNAEIASINDKYDLEQFEKASAAAHSLVKMAADYKKEESKKWAYTNLLKLNPQDRTALLSNWRKLVDGNNNFIDNAASRAILDGMSSTGSAAIAEDILRATGWRRKALHKATMADKLSLIPDIYLAKMGESRGAFGDNGPAVGTKEREVWEANNPTLNELRERMNDPKADPLSSEELQYANNLSGKILAEITEVNFIPYYDAKEIYTKVQPILDTFHGDTVQDVVNNNARAFQESLIAAKHKDLLSTLKEAAVNPDKNAVQDIVTQNYNVWSQIDEDGYSGATQKSLKSVLELSAADKISHIQASEFVDELIQIPGQCHIKKGDECFTTLRHWRPNDLAAVDFDNELLKISMKDVKVKTADYDGMIKVAKDALQEQFINSGNRPISTEQLKAMTDMVHQRAGGRWSDIYKALMESVDTAQGLTDEEGLEQLANDSDYGNRPRDPKDYQHLSHQAILKAHEKGYLTSSASYLSKSELKTFGQDIDPIVKSFVDSEGGTDLESGVQGINIIDNAKRILEANYYYELRTNPTLDKSANLQKARQNTLAFLGDEKNLASLKAPRIENAERVAERNRHEVEIDKAGTNEVALSGFKYRIKLAIKEVQLHRAKGNDDITSKLISATYLREDGTTGVFFDDNWRAAARAAQQSPEKFLETQLLMNGYDSKTNVYTLPEGDNKLIETGSPAAPERVNKNNTHPSNEDQLTSYKEQLQELKNNKPEFRAKGIVVGGVDTGIGGGSVIKTDKGIPVATQWRENIKSIELQIKALEDKIRREKEASQDLIGKPVGNVKNQLPDMFGYPISFNKEMLKRLGFKDREPITEDMLAHLSRRSDLLFNPDTPFPEYTLYGGIG